MSHRAGADEGATAAAVPRSRNAVLKWSVRAVAALGALVGAWVCYGFGLQVSGLLLGVVAGVNGGVFGALIAGTLADGLVSRLDRA